MDPAVPYFNHTPYCTPFPPYTLLVHYYNEKLTAQDAEDSPPATRSEG